MGIRDKSYYGWENLPLYRGGLSASFRDAVIVSGTVYACGMQSKISDPTVDQWFTAILTPGDVNWRVVDEHETTPSLANGIIVDHSGNIYVNGKVLSDDTETVVRKSFDFGETWADVDNNDDTGGFGESTSTGMGFGLGVYGNSLPRYWFTSYESTPGSPYSSWEIYRSTTEDPASGSFTLVDTHDGTPLGLAINTNEGTVKGDVWVVGTEAGATEAAILGGPDEFTAAGGPSENWRVIKAAQGGASFSSQDFFLSASVLSAAKAVTIVDSTLIRRSQDDGANWTTVFSQSDGYIYGIDSDGKGNVFATMNSGTDLTDAGGESYILHSVDGTTWNQAKVMPDERLAFFYRLRVDKSDSDDTVYLVGQSQGKLATIRKGRLRANSASLGPRMLATSVGFVSSEVDGEVVEKFKLNNLSEFPHSSGLFQMRNLVLGTTDSGKIGKDASRKAYHYF